MSEESLTVQILREIRDGVRETNVRLDETNVRLDETNVRVGRLESVMVQMAEQQRFVVRWIRSGAQRTRRMEGDIALLKARVEAIEKRLPAEPDAGA